MVCRERRIAVRSYVVSLSTPSAVLALVRFIDLLCLKRSGQLVRYVMSRDDVASCAEERLDFSVTCAIVDVEQNQLFVVPFSSQSISVWKIMDTKPSLIKAKEIFDNDGTDGVYIYGLALSPDGTCLVALLSDQSIVLYQHNDYLRRSTQVKIADDRPPVCDCDYWDDKVCFHTYLFDEFHTLLSRRRCY